MLAHLETLTLAHLNDPLLALHLWEVVHMWRKNGRIVMAVLVLASKKTLSCPPQWPSANTALVRGCEEKHPQSFPPTFLALAILYFIFVNLRSKWNGCEEKQSRSSHSSCFRHKQLINTEKLNWVFIEFGIVWHCHTQCTWDIPSEKISQNFWPPWNVFFGIYYHYWT